MKLISCIGVLLLLTLASFIPNATNQPVKEYLGIPGPIDFNKTNFALSWSAHPSPTYYKQEYLPAKQQSETFTKMIMVEAVVGDISLEDAARAKMNELDERKKTDPVTNYQVIKNPSTGEILLDFVISQGSGKAAIVEWNAYRYINLKEKAGKKGVMLFAYCKRGYGDGSTNFLKALKTERQADVKFLATYKIPAVKISGS